MMQTDRDEAAPRRKRARTSDSNADTGSLERDHEFWYDDGTIVLVADNIEFRVYRGPLAKHSPVFRDMLALSQTPTLPQSTSSASEVELPVLHHQCPTVHVTDSPLDLRHFLRAFVPGDVLEPRDSSTLTFDAVSAWIRLGHKYEVDKLVENGLKYLRGFYPNSLASFYGFPGPIKQCRPEDLRRHAAIAIVNLARLTGANDLLPLALLECCKLKADIIDGYMREDGTVEHLRPEDMGRCFAAKDVLVVQAVAACLLVFENARVDAECRDAETCQELIDNSAFKFRTVYIDFMAVDELLVHEQMESVIVEADELCSRCRPDIQKDIEKRRIAFWNALPRVFDVAVEKWEVKGRR